MRRDPKGDKYREVLREYAQEGDPVKAHCDHCDAPVFDGAGDAGGDRSYGGGLMAFPATCVVCEAEYHGVPVSSLWPFDAVTE